MWLTDRAMPFNPPLAPGPDGGADEVNRRDTLVLQPALQPQAEIRRIHADEGRRPIGQQPIESARRMPESSR